MRAAMVAVIGSLSIGACVAVAATAPVRSVVGARLSAGVS
jgi:hypothetical protein